MTYRAYFDESEEHPIFAVGGFIGKEKTWDELEPKWQRAIPHGIPYFHATDCFGGRKAFRDLDISERTTLLDRLTDLIVEHEVFLLGGAVLVPVYREFAPKPKENDFGGNKYSAAFEYAIERACHSMDNHPLPRDIGEQCAFLMERNEYSNSAGRKIKDLRNDDFLWWRNRIGTDTYGDKEGPRAIPLLQVADLGAFLIAKVVAKAPQGKIPWWPYLQKLANSRRVHGITNADEKSLRLIHIVHQSLKNGEDFIAEIEEKSK